jgi:hypothetical protein
MTELVAERGWLETASVIASLILSITLLALTVIAAPAALQFWRTFKKMQAMLDRFEADVGPLARNARALATRLGELTALLAVAQEEAEAAFVATAAAVRGVRSGAATLRNGARDGDEEPEAELEEEDENGDDDKSDEDAHERERRLPRNEERVSGRPARPRLRSHRPERS